MITMLIYYIKSIINPCIELVYMKQSYIFGKLLPLVTAIIERMKAA